MHRTRPVITFILCACTALVMAETGNVFNPQEEEIQKALATLNDYRKRAGLKTVKLNIELSKGCYNHSKYKVKNNNHPQASKISPHYEIDSLPYATKDGKKAGLSSCMAYVKPNYAMDQFMSTFYHRMPLIDPNATEVGIGYYTENYTTVCCVDMRGSWKWDNDTVTKVVVYPEQWGMDITPGFQSENPNPIPDSIDDPGFPITIQFFRQYGLKNVKVKVTDNKGQIVDCLLSTPEKPLTDFPQHNTVCIIPKNRLKYNTNYTVDFSCVIDGKPFTKTWSFYTRIYLG